MLLLVSISGGNVFGRLTVTFKVSSCQHALENEEDFIQGRECSSKLSDRRRNYAIKSC